MMEEQIAQWFEISDTGFKGVALSWNKTLALSSQADWNLGTYSNTEGATSLGDVKLEYPIDTFDDFEDGSVSDWWMYYCSGGYGHPGACGYGREMSAVTSPVEQGTYSAKISVGTDGYVIAHKAIGSPVTPNYISLYLQRASDNDWDEVYIGKSNDGGKSIDKYIMKLHLEGVNISYWNTGTGSYENIATYTNNTWIFMEFQNINFTAHTLDIWIDNSQKKTGASFVNNDANSFDCYGSYLYWTVVNNGITTYLDNIIYSSGYNTSGTHTSQVLDLGITPSFAGTLTVSKTEPDANHTITFQERHGNQSNLSDASAYATIANNGTLLAGYRYWQIKTTFTGDGSNTPTLSDYTLSF